VPRAYRFALAPKWVIGHVIVLAAAVTMVFLGRWQLDVSDSKHFSLQNFGYALQWWAFTAFALGLWGRVLRDAARSRAASAAGAPAPGSQPAEPAPAADEPVAYRRYVMPQSSDRVAPAGDAELAAYNDYLARLAAGDPAREENR
jgi:DNA-binding transcriptional regulator of glucitol operon